MTRASVIREMERKAHGAPDYIHDKRTLVNAVVGLSYPSPFGKKKAEELYLKATGEYLKQKTLKHKIQMDYTLKVLLFTDVDKKDEDTGEGTNELDEETRKKHKRYLTKKYPKR